MFDSVEKFSPDREMIDLFGVNSGNSTSPLIGRYFIRLCFVVLSDKVAWGATVCGDDRAEILSRKSSRRLLKNYVQHLRDNKFGPRQFDPYKYRRRRQRADAGEDRDGDASGSDEEDERQELRRVDESLEEDRLDEDDYQPQTQLFSSAEETAAALPSQDDYDIVITL